MSHGEEPASTTHPPVRASWVRRNLGALLAVVATVAACAGVYAYGGAHRVLPGYTGCRIVRDLGSRIDCVASVLRADIKAHGRRAAAGRLRRRAERVGAIEAACHLAWHEIGAADGRKALARGVPLTIEHITDDVCAQGYAHGFTITYLDRSARTAVIRDASSLCVSQARDRRDFINCMHSVGHSLRKTAGNVRSVRDCESSLPAGVKGLPPRPPGAIGETRTLAVQDCVRGVFMQQVLEVMKHQGSPSPVVDPCIPDIDRLDSYGRNGCYMFLPARVRMLGGSTEDAGRTCLAVKNERDAITCVTAYVTADTMARCSSVVSRPTLHRACTRMRARVKAGSSGSSVQ